MMNLMQVKDFLSTLEQTNPPSGVSSCLEALWYYRQGNWGKAHEIVQDLHSDDAAWVHAFLHRDEGDLWNADYWYRRAGKSRPSVPLEEEWVLIAEALI